MYVSSVGLPNFVLATFNKANMTAASCAVSSLSMYADHSLADEEKIKLDDFAEYFEFKDKDRDEYIRLAQDYTIENLIKDKGRLTREELYEFADNIGMDRGEAERAQIKVDKRGIL